MKVKVNEEDMKNYELIANNKLDELKLMSNRKFAYKADTSKRLKYLDTQIKYIIELLKSKEKTDNNWLLAKKPIGGYSCAACEKYLGDLKENGEHVPWNKYPKRDKDKNYRVGNGFSRMLNMLNLDIKSTVEGLKESNYDSDDEYKQNAISSNRHVQTVSNNIISFNKGIVRNFNDSNQLPKLNSESNDGDNDGCESLKMASTCTNKYRGNSSGEIKKPLSPHIVKVYKKK